MAIISLYVFGRCLTLTWFQMGKIVSLWNQAWKYKLNSQSSPAGTQQLYSSKIFSFNWKSIHNKYGVNRRPTKEAKKVARQDSVLTLYFALILFHVRVVNWILQYPWNHWACCRIIKRMLIDVCCLLETTDILFVQREL